VDVEAHVPGDRLPEIAFEVVHGRYYTGVLRPAWRVLILLVALAVPAAAAPAAPAFRAPLLDGSGSVDSGGLIGKKIVVLRFQASWCKPCGRESAALDRVAARYRDRGVEVIAVHVQDTVADARRFARERKVTYTIVLDPRLSVGNRFGFKGTPYTVVIDRRGEMVERLHGESVVLRLPRVLDGLLAEQQRPTRTL
jgi:peroxiredoxin